MKLTVTDLTVSWHQQGPDEHVLSVAVYVNATRVDKRQRRVRRTPRGAWYVQRATDGGWRAINPHVDYLFLGEAKAEAEASLTPEDRM